MGKVAGVVCVLAALLAAGPVAAEQQCANPDALGVSRTIVVDPGDHPRLGAVQYSETLPLADKEVVLTFDDGPLPPYTSRVLDILAQECVKATFFMVGRMAQGYPQVVRRAFNEGHTIANHSQNHPFTFSKMLVEQAAREVDDGFASLQAAVGEPNAVAPFFRIPGLLRQDSVERYLASRSVMIWSVDFLADDWTHIKAHEVLRRALNRIEARGRGILLLHDIQPAAVLALPDLLKELKARGYRIVHVVPATAERPKTPTEPEQWAVRQTPQGIWPRIATAGLEMAEPELAAPNPRNLGVTDRGGVIRVAFAPSLDRTPAGADQVPLPPVALWPRAVQLGASPDRAALPAPAGENFTYTRVWRPAIRVAAPHKGTSRKFAASHRKVAVAPATPTKEGAQAARPRPLGHQLQIQRPTSSLTAPDKIGLRMSAAN